MPSRSNVSLEPPLLLEAVSGDIAIPYSARQLRTLADAVWSVDGVISSSDLVPTQRAAGANMSVDVSAGLCVITGDAIAYQGKYVQRSTAVTNLTVNAAPSSGSRTDLIVAQLYDKQADGGSTYGWSLLVLPGTTTVPASAIELGRLTITAGATSVVNANISTTSRQFAAIGGSKFPVYSQQGSVPDFNAATDATVYNFTSAQWAPLTFSMPPSGRAFVTISADMYSEQADSSAYTECSWSVSSGSATVVGTGRSIAGSGIKFNQSRRTLITGTAGASITITPQYRVNHGSNEWSNIQYGMLIVEPV
jgi:hypothetical protein